MLTHFVVNNLRVTWRKNYTCRRGWESKIKSSLAWRTSCDVAQHHRPITSVVSRNPGCKRCGRHIVWVYMFMFGGVRFECCYTVCYRAYKIACKECVTKTLRSSTAWSFWSGVSVIYIFLELVLTVVGRPQTRTIITVRRFLEVIKNARS